MNKNLIIAGGATLIAGGLAYYLLQQNGWPNGTVTCWKCEGEIPVSKTFPKGAICGLGAAIEYPFYTKPINCGGNDSDIHIATGYSAKMVYATIVGRLPGVLMEVTDESTGIVYSDISDDNGNWSIEVPLNGIYTVTASKENHTTQTMYGVDWSRYPGEWDWGPFYSRLEYLFNYDLIWNEAPHWQVNFYMLDYDDWNAAGHLQLSGFVDMFPSDVVTLDIRGHTEDGGSFEIYKTTSYFDTHIEVNKYWDQSIQNKIKYISVWGQSGLWYAGVDNINLNFKRHY